MLQALLCMFQCCASSGRLFAPLAKQPRRAPGRLLHLVGAFRAEEASCSPDATQNFQHDYRGLLIDAAGTLISPSEPVSQVFCTRPESLCICQRCTAITVPILHSCLISVDASDISATPCNRCTGATPSLTVVGEPRPRFWQASAGKTFVFTFAARQIAYVNLPSQDHTSLGSRLVSWGVISFGTLQSIQYALGPDDLPLCW